MSVVISRWRSNLRRIHPDPPYLEKRWGVPYRALISDLRNGLASLREKGRFVSLHMSPFARDDELGLQTSDAVQEDFVTQAGAFVTLVKARICAKAAFLAVCDGMPNFTSIQLQRSDGGICVPRVVGLALNRHHDRLVMTEQERRTALGQLEQLCPIETVPVDRGADSKAGDSVPTLGTTIVKPCVMVSPQFLHRPYEPWEYGVDLRPRYWDFEKNEFVEVPNLPNRGEIMKIGPPDGVTCGKDFVTHIVGASWEKEKRLILIGAMETSRFFELAVKIKILSRVGKVVERLIMPFAATCWMPMIEFLKPLNGFDRAMRYRLRVAGPEPWLKHSSDCETQSNSAFRSV